MKETIEKILEGRDLSKPEHEKLIKKILAGLELGTVSRLVVSLQAKMPKLIELALIEVANEAQESAEFQLKVTGIDEVREMTGLSKKEIDDLIKKSLFPKRRNFYAKSSEKRKGGTIGWPRTDIEKWVKSNKKEAPKNCEDKLLEAMEEQADAEKDQLSK